MTITLVLPWSFWFVAGCASGVAVMLAIVWMTPEQKP